MFLSCDFFFSFPCNQGWLFTWENSSDEEKEHFIEIGRKKILPKETTTKREALSSFPCWHSKSEKSD